MPSGQAGSRRHADSSDGKPIRMASVEVQRGAEFLEVSWPTCDGGARRLACASRKHSSAQWTSIRGFSNSAHATKVGTLHSSTWETGETSANTSAASSRGRRSGRSKWRSPIQSP
jgi:hypothetical protein